MHRLVPTALVVLTAVPLSAQQPAPPVGTPHTEARAVYPAKAPSAIAPKLLPGTEAKVFATIQGNALSSTNRTLPHVAVRLRDARYGHIAGTQITDASGLFAFVSIDPGNYVVELVASDQLTVLAASEIIDVGAGEAVSAFVKLPFRVPPFAKIIGHSAGQAAAVSSAAAAAGVLATTATGEPASPR